MRVARLMRVGAAALLLSCLSAVVLAQSRAGRGGAATTVVQRRMPPVIGLALDAAQRVVLSATGLTCGARQLQGANAAPTDSVVRQFPARGQPVTIGMQCTLYVVSRTPPQVPRTPSVLGRSLQDAVTILRRADLRPTTVTVPSADTALASVLDQDPKPDAPIRPDRTIVLTIAGVPKLTGLSRSDAINAIRRAHLQVGAVADTEISAGKNDVVMQQSPVAAQLAMP